MTAAAIAAYPRRQVAPPLAAPHALAVAGGAVILFWFAVALLAPVISPYNPEFVDIASRLQPPSHAHWLGTDALGRDVLSRVLYGSRISLIAGFSVVVISAVFGTVLGAIAAYIRGRGEELLMRLTDLVLCFRDHPGDGHRRRAGRRPIPSSRADLVAKYARLAAASCSSSARRNYVEAAHVRASATRLFRHVVPNAVGPLIVMVTLDLGNDPRLRRPVLPWAGHRAADAGWGDGEGASSCSMVGRDVSGLAIPDVVMRFFVGDGIRDWLDPHARGAELSRVRARSSRSRTCARIYHDAESSARSTA
jgi:peptide/nickel transport system permease protein